MSFALACLVMITVHELAHALAAVALGLSPTMYGDSVETHATTDTQQVVTALAGPVASLVIGLAVLALPEPRWSPVWRLALLWFGLLDVQEFSGYLITGPFAGIGDIGQVLKVTNAPAVVGWAGFLAGWAGTYLTGRQATRRLARFVTDEPGPSGEPAPPLGPQLRAVGLFAWLLGSVLAVVLSAGLLTAGGVSAGVVAFEALGTATSGLFLIFVRLFLPLARPDGTAPALLPAPVGAAVALAVVAVVRQVLLAGGLTL